MADLLSKDMLADLIINIANILILFFVTRKLLYKPVKKYLAQRKERAAAAVKEAEDAQARADAERAKYEALLAEAEAEKAKVLAQAAEQARQEAADITANAQRQAEGIMAEAAADAQAVRDKAARDSKDAITDIALEISGKLMGRAVTDADNRRIVDSFFAE